MLRSFASMTKIVLIFLFQIVSHHRVNAAISWKFRVLLRKSETEKRMFRWWKGTKQLCSRWRVQAAVSRCNKFMSDRWSKQCFNQTNYIFDTGSGVFLWHGQGKSYQTYEVAMTPAQDLLASKTHPWAKLLGMIMETVEFKRLFADWHGVHELQLKLWWKPTIKITVTEKRL